MAFVMGSVSVVVTHVNNGVHRGVEVEEHGNSDVLRRSVVRKVIIRVPQSRIGSKIMIID